MVLAGMKYACSDGDATSGAEVGANSAVEFDRDGTMFRSRPLGRSQFLLPRAVGIREIGVEFMPTFVCPVRKHLPLSLSCHLSCLSLPTDLVSAPLVVHFLLPPLPNKHKVNVNPCWHGGLALGVRPFIHSSLLHPTILLQYEGPVPYRTAVQYSFSTTQPWITSLRHPMPKTARCPEWRPPLALPSQHLPR